MTRSRLAISIAMIAVILLQVRLWTGEGSLAHVSGLSQEVSVAQAEVTAKRKRNEILKAEVLDLRDGLDAIEERARSELGLIAPGETFYLVLEED